MAFPASPTNGQKTTINNVSYTYNSTTGAWIKSGAVADASPVSSVASRTGAVTLTAADIGSGTYTGTYTYSNGLTVTGTCTATTFSGALSGTATAATTATNLSGGSVAGTTGTFSSTLNTVGLFTANADVRSLGQIRAVGWYNTPSSSYGGLACEIGVSSGQAYLLSYNRDSSSYGAFNINATSTTINNGTSITAGGLGVGTTASGTSGEIRATNQITAYYSDKRLKTEVGKIENALDKIDQLCGIIYTQNKLAEDFGYDNYNEQVGLYAQDVEQVQPQAVKPAPFDIAEDGSSKSGENYLTVQYERLIPLLVEGIKELRAEVRALKDK